MRPFGRSWLTMAVICLGLSFAVVPVAAGYKDDIGYTQLVAELGAGLPVGGGVPVAQAEASTGTVDHDGNPDTDPLPIYLPNPSDVQFGGKVITDRSNLESGSWSGHATSAGRNIYGNMNSIAPGIAQIDAYLAEGWLQGDFLRAGNSSKPRSSDARVTNHSWIASSGEPQVERDILSRLDWTIETDESIQVAGSRNNTGSNLNLLSGAFNIINVGRTDGLHGISTNTIDSDYVSGRARPDIVAPFGNTSSATAGVSSAAALLVGAGHDNTAWSTDPVTVSTTNRAGTTIYNAERAEVIKAVLMAGALRATANTTGADITGYRLLPANQTANGLDTRFGAGQLNIYNSYRILASGEQNSEEDDGSGTGAVEVRGFDYDPAFGGGGGSNSTASYHFVAVGGVLTATLTWHIDISGGPGALFNDAATLHDLDLLLYDVTAAPVLVAASTSTIDNSETIMFTLEAGHDYRLQVIPATTLQWDYALAWQIAPDNDGDGVPDAQDNCPLDANAGQLDTDNDRAGDVCDDDDDGDGIPDLQDAFPLDPSEHTDTDADGIGNNADPDDDNDGFDDSVELALGHDPLNTADAPELWDLDNNGVVDTVDVMLASRAVTGTYTPSTEQLAVGRIAPLVNGVPAPEPGNAIRTQDLLLMTRKALGLAVY